MAGEERRYVASCPGLLYAGCHGDDEQAVFEQLCLTVDEAIDHHKEDGKPLPPPTSSRDYVSTMLRLA